MFTTLLLAATFMTGTATMPATATLSADRPMASAEPFAIVGPVRTRVRKPTDTATATGVPGASSAFAFHQQEAAALAD